MMTLIRSVILTLLGVALSAQVSLAAAIVPPQPPSCSWCDGPPPPPIPVPTIAPTVVSPISVISVKLSPTHLQRGQTTTLQVIAGAQDDVTTVVQYRDTKARTTKVHMGDSHVLKRVWKVPQTAGLGKAQVKVTVNDPSGPYTTTISFEVVK